MITLTTCSRFSWPIFFSTTKSSNFRLFLKLHICIKITFPSYPIQNKKLPTCQANNHHFYPNPTCLHQSNLQNNNRPCVKWTSITITRQIAADMSSAPCIFLVCSCVCLYKNILADQEVSIRRTCQRFKSEQPRKQSLQPSELPISIFTWMKKNAEPCIYRCLADIVESSSILSNAIMNEQGVRFVYGDAVIKMLCRIFPYTAEVEEMMWWQIFGCNIKAD